ncbi:leader peptidase (prepilin peptidase)/N-methyltransferase [Agromyces hippuratus]|uniref:Leader peptidase (Prepilin peptidase)/N-methyltransferase n=2 Tax=Agromyces hippuratus TaxID=286438 RepID=A0A852WX27_9MICO|nr:A24 family peptidase [Agromyces hippuratus]NYG22128.1 leader peptidase (prepilin peptidase)/N-methyltransferase [Agromyces hippuratus]
MPFAWSSLIVTVVAVLLGFALGWWPLAAWTERSMTGERMPRRTLRLTAAITTAVVFGVLAWRFGLSWTLPALLAFAACATVLSIVDLAEKRLPNAVVFPALGAVAVLLVPATWATGIWMSLVWALVGSAAMFAVYFVLALISPSSMGMGDVKLALVIGLLLGWFGMSAWLVGLLAAFVVGGVIAIVALVLKRVTLRGSIPFGPSMLVGALIAVLLVGPVG